MGTAGQIKTITILSHVGGSLSVVGSSLILFDICKRRFRLQESDRNQSGIRRRLIAGMSTCDLFSSMAYAFASVPIPASYPLSPWNFGNQQTCTAQGFFLQWQVGAICYNTCIATYYYLVIHQGKTEAEISMVWERLFHAICIVMTLGTSISGLFLEVYNPVPWYCWVYSSPLACVQNGVPCRRGSSAWICHYIFLLGPLWLAMIVIAILMLVTYRKVKRQEKRSRRYTFGRTSSTLRRSQLFQRQAVLYVGVFYAVWTFRCVQRVASEIMTTNVPFWILFLAGLFAPLQGVGNAMVYFLPQNREIFHRLCCLTGSRRGSTSSVVGSSSSARNSSNKVLANGEGEVKEIANDTGDHEKREQQDVPVSSLQQNERDQIDDETGSGTP